MVRTCLALFASLLFLSSLPAQEGRLGQVRREVEEEKDNERPAPLPPPPDDGDHGSTYGSYGADDSWSTNPENPLGEFVVVAGAYTAYATVAAPFVIPRWLMGDTGQSLYFPRHPYDRGHPGYLALDVDASAEAAERWQGRHAPRWWMARVSIEDGNDFNGLNRVGGQVLLDTASRFGVVTNWDHFHEWLGGGHDVTTIGDITFLCRFAQSEHAVMRAGVGCRIMTDDHATNAGVNLHYGGEWFPCEPWVVTGGIDIGNLGNAFVFRGRATAGVLWNGIEAFGGYDWMRIGDVNLHGPMLGVRFWF